MSGLKPAILYEAPDFMAVDKPAGVLSQKDKSGAPDLAAILGEQLKAERGKTGFLAPVHRLDRNVSGLILLAKSPEGARRLTEKLRAGRIHRVYLAIVKGDPGESGEYRFRLLKDEAANTTRVNERGEEAHTEFQRLQKMGNSSLVRIILHTGRSHQIRVHFSHAGHALLGDKKYARKPWSEIFHRPALHAHELLLSDDKNEPLRIQAPPPEDLRGLLTRLGGSPDFFGAL